MFGYIVKQSKQNTTNYKSGYTIHGGKTTTVMVHYRHHYKCCINQHSVTEKEFQYFDNSAVSFEFIKHLLYQLKIIIIIKIPNWYLSTFTAYVCRSNPAHIVFVRNHTDNFIKIFCEIGRCYYTSTNILR